MLPRAPMAGKGICGQGLPFGLWSAQGVPNDLLSAPLIFSAVADALLWIKLKQGVPWAIHYMDDFLMIGHRDSDKCQINVAVMHETFSRAGLPLEPSKTQNPLHTITFLRGYDCNEGPFAPNHARQSHRITQLLERSQGLAESVIYSHLLGHSPTPAKWYGTAASSWISLLTCLLLQGTWITSFILTLSLSWTLSGGFTSWKTGIESQCCCSRSCNYPC